MQSGNYYQCKVLKRLFEMELYWIDGIELLNAYIFCHKENKREQAAKGLLQSIDNGEYDYLVPGDGENPLPVAEQLFGKHYAKQLYSRMRERGHK